MKTPSRNEVLKVNILLRVAFNNSPTAIRANYYNVYYTVHIIRIIRLCHLSYVNAT